MSKLRDIRRNQGLSTNDLADLTGIPDSTIRCYETYPNQINKAKPLNIYKLTQVLNCGYGDILELDIEEKEVMTNLKEIRTSKGLSQSQLANASGVNVRMIQKYEQGERSLNKAEGLTLYKLSQALGCNIENLLELEK